MLPGKSKNLLIKRLFSPQKDSYFFKITPNLSKHAKIRPKIKTC
jgi:hypothetical protein